MVKYNSFIFYHKRKSYQSTMCPNNTLARNPPKRHDSKRQLLSLASRLFDPLGCLAPFTIRAKRLFQLLWLKVAPRHQQRVVSVEERTGDPGKRQSPMGVDGHSQRSDPPLWTTHFRRCLRSSVWRRGICDDGVPERGQGGEILPRQDPRRSGQATEPPTARVDGCA
ncbi:conserved hypothetical protein [Trichinella spiralis]|uniref:hypothetical protein n=1 Tax=Trichinella spiralis TaxID=6334 RepID=UPI0001EFD1E0|nr:conserved hypothetical protein [Trichinella spiralis]